MANSVDLIRTSILLLFSIVFIDTSHSGALSDSKNGEFFKGAKVLVDRSKSENSLFNYVFQQRLIQNNFSTRDASKYSLNLPGLNNGSQPNTDPRCATATPLAAEALQSYCDMQSTLTGLAPQQISPASTYTDNQELFSEKYQNILSQIVQPQNETLVIIIPGVFGEFIDQTAFGEIFGEGKNKLRKSKSRFEIDFSDFKNKLTNEEIQKYWLDNRFMLSNLLPQSNSKLKDFERPIEMPKWIKTASVDTPDKKQSLFRVAVLGLESMSFESIGKQSHLAELYLRRLHKFISVYEKYYGHLPANIVFIGYSRGTPIGLEMLAKIEEAKIAQQRVPEWTSKIRSMISLGGVVFGSALADQVSVKREVVPSQTKLILAVKKLLTDFLPMPESSIDVFTKELPNVLLGSAKSQQFENSRTQLINILAINSVLIRNFINELRAISLSDSSYSKTLEPILTKLTFYENKLTVNLKSKFGEATDNHQVFSFFNEVLAPSYLAIIESLHSSVDMLVMKENRIKTTLNGLQFLPNPLAYSAFNKKLSFNWGLQKSLQTLENAKGIQKLKILLIEANRNIFRLSHFFNQAWSAITELSTDERLKWWVERGPLLPEAVHYFTIAATLADKGSAFYQAGIDYGYDRASVDQLFLNQNWNDLKSVGILSSKDGINSTYVASEVNDGQVDWHKTIFWPKLASDLTGGKKFNSTFLGFVRTHHWGLALPFAFDSLDLKEQHSTIVNPFPRAELLESIVLSTFNFN